MGINIEKSFKTFLKTLIKIKFNLNQILLKIGIEFLTNYFEIFSSGELGLAYKAFCILPAKKDVRPAFTPKSMA